MTIEYSADELDNRQQSTRATRVTKEAARAKNTKGEDAAKIICRAAGARRAPILDRARIRIVP